jgi:hypothetical protein
MESKTSDTSWATLSKFLTCRGFLWVDKVEAKAKKTEMVVRQSGLTHTFVDHV